MSGVWFTSDLHIGHGLVADIRATALYVSRIAPRDSDEGRQHVTNWHDTALAAHWDSKIKPDDQVWVLGDISAGGTAAQEGALEWFKSRAGRKHLITGNHDGCHPMHRNAHKWQQDYLEVFDSVQPFARRKIDGKNVLLSHFPYNGDHVEVERYSPYRLRDEGLPLLHGHTHANDVVTHSTAGSLQISVGVDAWSLGPVHLSDIAKLIS